MTQMNDKNENIVLEKSYKFALRTVKLYKYLVEVRKEFVMSKQMLYSGTNIGAHIKGAQEAESRAGFFHEMNAALQQSSKCEFWLELLHDGEFLEDKEFNSIHADCVELIKPTKKITEPTRHLPLSIRH